MARSARCLGELVAAERAGSGASRERGGAGHSPGHTAFPVDGRLLIRGDLIHRAAVQFARPEVTSAFDDDPAQARAMPAPRSAPKPEMRHP